MRWSYDIKRDGDQTSFHGSPLITDDLIVIGTDGQGIGYVYAFDIADGDVRWKHPIARGAAGYRGATTDIYRSGSNLYVAAFGDELICLDLDSGQMKWKFQSTGKIDDRYFSRSPAVVADRVFFGGISGNVYALDAGDGKLIWKREIGGRISTHLMALGDDIYLGAANNHLYRLSQKTGAIVAYFSLETIPVGHIVAAKDSLLIFLNPGGGDGGARDLACLDLSLTGMRWKASGKWSFTRAHAWRGSALAGNEAGEVRALNMADGSYLWSQKFKGVIRSIGGSDDTLYIGTLNGTLYAYRPK